MKIEIFYESKSGNGKKVVEKFRELMVATGHMVNLHHIKEVDKKAIPAADLYVFSSPTRIGKPVGSMRRFAKKASLPLGANYALIATHMATRPDKKTGKMPTPEETAAWQRNIPIMEEILNGKGLRKIAELKVYVIEMKGPLEDGWERKVAGFADEVQSFK